MPIDPKTQSPAPLSISILWHQHQPDYRLGDHFLLPWVWLHATKDYLEMAQHLERVPAMRATINLTPVLLKQLEEYLGGKNHDPVVQCMVKPASALSEQEKQLMLNDFFLANEKNMIGRSQRYQELLALARTAQTDGLFDTSRFAEAEYRDLAVLFGLAWTGEFARETEPARSLIKKGRGFTEEDKTSLVNFHRELVRQIVPLHKKLVERGQLELTTTPYYHPILPLVIDTNSASEEMPEAPLPVRRFQYPADASEQIRTGREYFQTQLGLEPEGMWPSEGSVSMAALHEIAKSGYRWVATDERILYRSIESEGKRLDQHEIAKYYPWRFETPSGPISIFFRNQWLSDKIGFDYYKLSADEAVADFIEHLLSIRKAIVDAYGEPGLYAASVNVILDGENCWEFYPENGREFLSKLYTALTTTPGIAPAQFSEVLARSGDGMARRLEQVVSGSWINGNFAIWIGAPQENAAWDALAEARKNFEAFSKRVNGSEETKKQRAWAMQELLIAEGSDWFWWYGDKHYSVNQEIFDELFRSHLRAMYVHLDERVPESLSYSISSIVERTSGALRPSGDGRITPVLDGLENAESWENGIWIEYKLASAMHRANSKGKAELAVGWDANDVYLRVLPDEPSIQSIRVEFNTPPGLTIELQRDPAQFQVSVDGKPVSDSVQGILKETAELAFPKRLLGGNNALKFALQVTYDAERSQRMPKKGWFEVTVNG